LRSTKPSPSSHCSVWASIFSLTPPTLRRRSPKRWVAYRWFCRLGLEDAIPDHSTFSKNRHGRFRDSGAFRRIFDEVVRPLQAHRTAEVESTKVMIERVEERFDLTPERLIGDTAYGTAPMLPWMVEEKAIEPHGYAWRQTDRCS
jgi:hypothetical protein